MPIYEFECSCGKKFIELRSIEDRNKVLICNCGEEAVRTIPSNYLLGFDKLGRSKK